MGHLKVDLKSPDLQQLQSFSQQVGDKVKLRAKHNPDGSVTLYTRGKGEALKDRLHIGPTKERKQLAKQVVDAALNKAASQPLSVSPAVTGNANYKARQQELAQTVAALRPPSGTTSLKGAQLKQALGGAADAVDHARREATLDAMGAPGEVLRALDSGDKQALKKLAHELGDAIGTRYAKSNPATQLQRTLSDGREVKDQLLAIFKDQLGSLAGPLGQRYDETTPEVRGFLDQVYLRALGHQNDHVQGDERVPVVDAQGRPLLDDEARPLTAFKTVVVGGKAYEYTGHLAKGGYGLVNLYTAVDGSQMAFKQALQSVGKTTADLHKEGVDEVLAHQQAQRGGHPNVLRLIGAVPLPDGTVAPAIEFAPLGNGADLIKKLGQAQGKMRTSDTALVQATLLKDMLQGLRHMQGGGKDGLMHLDVKPSNYLLGEDGKLKLSDFGTAVEGKKRSVQDVAARDQPRWAAPELMYMNEKRVEANQLKALMGRADMNLPRAAEELEQKLAQLLPEQAFELMHASTDPFTVQPSMDAWSVGVAAYELYMGELPFSLGPGENPSALPQKVVNFGQNPQSLAIPQPVPGLDEGVRALINGLMHPDPGKRLTVADALKSDVFQQPGVGSSRVRDMIKGIAKPAVKG